MTLNDSQLGFIHSNWPEVPNPEIAKTLGIKLCHLQNYLYIKGMHKVRLEYWTEEQVEFLKANFRKVGDRELAELFTARWPKEKGWTLKHIEKKRMYLKLKRSKEEVSEIKQRNIRNGSWDDANRKMWETRGVFPEGSIRYWKKGPRKETPFIKVDGIWIHWARWRYKQIHGSIEEEMNVIFLDCNARNRSDENLGLVSNAELSKRNSLIASMGLSDNYVAGMMCHNQPELKRMILNEHLELIEIKRLQLNLNRTINENL